MFVIGDKIVYPMHGAGIIEDIEEKKILGDTASYYVLKLPIGNMKLMIPVNNYKELGLRDIVDEKTIDEVVEILKKGQDEEEINWNKRYRKNMEKIKTGDIGLVAGVVRNLYLLDEEKGLSTGEKKMLNNAKQILVSEFVLVKNIDKEEAEEFILKNIK
ncbi:CarD family transcriptional regulator [Alkalibaculum sp. M08DMB]|uniref:CarD family transcriptional regulator n=1 Tax=Alkalibaculum sporogenes TaxID=2655001 RepID=A0A6A7KCR9_9FIRM|nr:CarD family transcriptional regulator [Alkalibaculum sporogenes]MPW27318.1 CarD family transcriptional regulator [Alkalibaculum sporogenes]